MLVLQDMNKTGGASVRDTKSIASETRMLCIRMTEGRKAAIFLSAYVEYIAINKVIPKIIRTRIALYIR